MADELAPPHPVFQNLLDATNVVTRVGPNERGQPMTTSPYPGATIIADGNASYRQPRSMPVFDVCPHCKRRLNLIDGPRGVCEEHGSVVAVRSVVVNSVLHGP